MTARRRVLTGLLCGLLLGVSPALAHHGWRWTEAGNIELTGTIVGVNLGNPHGRLDVQVNDEMWLVEVGQPWRNERVGLTDELLSEGTEITAIGQRAADQSELRLKAERVMIAGNLYDLYPGRD